MKLNLLFNNFAQTQGYLTHFLKPDTAFFFMHEYKETCTIRASKLIMESLVTYLPKIPASIGQLTIKRQESLKQRHPGSHDASIGDEAGATKSHDFLNKEYDDLVKFRKQAEERISAMKKSLAVISLSRVNNLAWAIGQAQEYSYSYTVKLVGVPETKPRENASETS